MPENKRALIIAADSAHACKIEQLLESNGLSDEILVLTDPVNDIGVQASLHRLASLGTVAAGAAHEVSNLLSYVNVTLERLARGHRAVAAASREAAMLTSAMECCRRMTEILRGITGFARGHDGPQVPLRIADVVDDAVSLVRAELGERAWLALKIDDDLPAVRGNADQLAQVLVNLLLNAMHAIDGSGPEDDQVTVRVQRDGEGVRVDVEDSGRGIPADQLGRVFEAFFTTRRDGGGTGLGLFLARGIVRKHGGELTIDSALGRGTRVTIYLPSN